MATIQPQTPVTLSQEWGVSFSDYKVNGKPVDFQDLMIEIGANRAVTVEAEVVPLTTRIKTRNTELDRLGSLLAIFTKTQADFASDAAGGDKKSVSGITSDQWDLLREAYVKRGGSDPGPTWRSSWANSDWTKSAQVDDRRPQQQGADGHDAPPAACRPPRRVVLDGFQPDDLRERHERKPHKEPVVEKFKV